jgi:hypothetical protein
MSNVSEMLIASNIRAMSMPHTRWVKIQEQTRPMDEGRRAEMKTGRERKPMGELGDHSLAGVRKR